MELIDYLDIVCNRCFINVKVVPNSRITSFIEAMSDGVLKIRIKSVPEKGKANKELINYLSKELKIKKSNISIVSGLTNKNKLVKIDL